MDSTDQKWLDAFKSVYPVEGAVLPYWTNSDDAVDATKTLRQFLGLVGVPVGEDGRIVEPYEH
jgi:hypothetical protein